MRRLLWLLSLALALTATASAQRFEWRDVVQQVEILRDGRVLVEDERTLWTSSDFGEAFICVRLATGERLTLLEGSGAVSPGPPAEALTQRCEDGSQGVEMVVRQQQRVSERRVRFVYQLDGTLDYYSDVVQWYWDILEREHPPIRGYRLEIAIPGPMAEPYDAFVHRYHNPELPRVALSEDRSRLTVAFERIPDGDGVEIRYLMDPALFDERGSAPGLERLLRDEARIAGLDAARRSPWWLALPLTFLGWLGWRMMGAHQRYGKEPDTSASMLYPFEPPADRPPAATALMLSQHSKNYQHAFHATVMDLARRGYGTFDTQGRKFNMHLDLDKDTSELLPFEREVLDYLKRAAQTGTGGLFRKREVRPEYLDFQELKAYSQSNMSRFMEHWSKDLKAWLERQLGGPLLDPKSQRVAWSWAGVAFLGAAASGLGAALTLGAAQLGFVIAIFISFALIFAAIFGLVAWRKEIAPEVYGWQGFRRTLSDYTRMKGAPDDFFMLWDRYYCYAAAMGVAERFLNNLQRAAPLRHLDEGALMSRAAWMGASTASTQNFSNFSRSISSLSSALSAASASASSGGSSSGGGGGGGGGSSGGR
jgi:uncharacterized membrane protein